MAHFITRPRTVSVGAVVQARQAELAALVAEAREQARHAAERGWHENPVLWFVVGVVAAGVVWIATAVR